MGEDGLSCWYAERVINSPSLCHWLVLDDVSVVNYLVLILHIKAVHLSKIEVMEIKTILNLVLKQMIVVYYKIENSW